MKVTLHLYNKTTSGNKGTNWYWIIGIPLKAMIDDIISIKDYKQKSSAIRAAKSFAKKHNFTITKEFENE